MESLDGIFGKFGTTKLHEIESIKDSLKLLKRSDTKYILHPEILPDLLEELCASYRMLDISEKRTFEYETLYFDDPLFGFYLAHHNRRLNRWKLRYRKYIDSGLCFFEMKFKSNKLQTIKERIRCEGFNDYPLPEAMGIIESKVLYGKGVAPDSLRPSLWTQFKRITLANRGLKERITIDTDIAFRDMMGNEMGLKGIAVAELKQETFSLGSPFARAAKGLRIYPEKFSKYCTGIAMMYKTVKRNRFKKRLLKIEKISKGETRCL